MRSLLPLILLVAACGPSGPFLPCMRECSADYPCPPGEPNPACEAALAECQAECSNLEPKDSNE